MDPHFFLAVVFLRFFGSSSDSDSVPLLLESDWVPSASDVVSPRVWTRACCLSASLRENDLEHSRHRWAFSPVWIRSWRLRAKAAVKDLVHWLQWNGLSSASMLLKTSVNGFRRERGEDVRMSSDGKDWMMDPAVAGTAVDS